MHLKSSFQSHFSEPPFVRAGRINASHQLSQQCGINPDAARITDVWDGERLDDLLVRHKGLIDGVPDLFADVQGMLAEAGVVLLLTDTQARIMVRCASPALTGFCERMGVRVGASLSESSCGTHAVNLALRYAEPAMLEGAAHFSYLFHACCSIAVPVMTRRDEPQACIALITAWNGALKEKFTLTALMARILAQQAMPRALGPRAVSEPRASVLSLGANKEALDLSPRKRRILSLLIQGHTCKEIAAGLDISPRTVESHLEQLRERFEARTTVEVVAKALQLGLV